MADYPCTLEEAQQRRYGPAGLCAYEPRRCAQRVMLSGGWPVKYEVQCSRRNGYGPAGLYCKQHARIMEAKCLSSITTR